MDLVIEVYQTLKNYIPQKDRQEASDTLMSIMVDMLNDNELKEFASSDAHTQRSYSEYVGDVEEYDDDNEYDE